MKTDRIARRAPRPAPVPSTCTPPFRRLSRGLSGSRHCGWVLGKMIRRPARFFRNTEIENLGIPILSNKDVRGLDVTMNDSPRVCGSETIGSLTGDIEHIVHLQRTAGNSLSKRLAIEKLQAKPRP